MPSESNIVHLFPDPLKDVSLDSFIHNTVGACREKIDQDLKNADKMFLPIINTYYPVCVLLAYQDLKERIKVTIGKILDEEKIKKGIEEAKFKDLLTLLKNTGIANKKPEDFLTLFKKERSTEIVEESTRRIIEDQIKTYYEIAQSICSIYFETIRSIMEEAGLQLNSDLYKVEPRKNK